MKAYQTFGVNFLPMSASSELEPGPSRVTTSCGLEGAANVGCAKSVARNRAYSAGGRRGEGSPPAKGKSIWLRHLPAAGRFYGRGFFVVSDDFEQGARLAGSQRKRRQMQLYATELMGAETYDDQGNFVGRVREFFIEPADQANRIARFLLSRGRFQPLVARYDQVADSRARHDPAELQRAGAGALSAERRMAGGSQRLAGSADHRHQRPESRARERRRPDRAAQ